MTDVGQRIREYRQAKGWTLEKLGSECNLTASFLSQVERNQSSLSIVSLETICEAIGVPVHELLKKDGSIERLDDSEVFVTKKASPDRIQLASTAISYRYVSSQKPGSVVEVLTAEFPPGHMHPQASHNGKEFGYVLEGQVRLRVGAQEHLLEQGDSYHFAATDAHALETVGDVPARVLLMHELSA
jgi:transcriptional regulator with XRE-family HTH domain